MKNFFGCAAAELKDLFYAPVEAVAKADIRLAQKVTQFIIRYGFTQHVDEEDTAIGRLKMVSFSFDDAGSECYINFPVLSLIQLPLLKVKGAEFSMHLKLVTTREKEPDKLMPPSLLECPVTKNTHEPLKTRIKAFLSPESKSVPDTMKANMKVNLSMAEGDMPGGISNLLNLINNFTKK